VLPSVQAPALVVTRTGTEVSAGCPEPAGGFRPHCAWLADALGTECHELGGNWVHSWRDAYEDEVLDLIEDFLVGAEDVRPPTSQRVLQTLMVTDIVGSTSVATSLGDAEWKHRLSRHDAIVHRQIARHRGRAIKQTGDGILASFDGPARAVACAHAIRHALATTGMHVRTGIHTGECEVRGDDVAGVAVHIAARVCSLAGADEILATATVRDLVIGSGLQFEDRGVHALRGVDVPWPLVAAVPGT